MKVSWMSAQVGTPANTEQEQLAAAQRQLKMQGELGEKEGDGGGDRGAAGARKVAVDAERAKKAVEK